MIANHPRFIDAITGKRKVNVRYYSKTDHGVLDLVCAAMDYGPGDGAPDGPNRYWFWDYRAGVGSHTLGLVPRQIVDLRVLGEVFDPVAFGVPGWRWSIPRDWPTSSA